MVRVQIPPGPYFSPCFQLQRFVGLQQKHGEEAFRSRKFQAEREAWIAAVFLLGYRQLSQQDWWLQQPDEDPPDIIAVAISDGAHGRKVERVNVEIFEYEHHTRADDLAGAITKKLARKAYPRDYRLVCYVHGHEKEPFTPIEVTEKIKATNPRIGEIWVVTSILTDDPEDYVVVRVYPDAIGYAVDYERVCEETTQMEMIYPSWGRGNDVEFGVQKVKLP